MKKILLKKYFWENPLNWLILLLVVLPVIYTQLTPEPTITLRNLFLAAFLLVYICFFFLIKKETPTILKGRVKNAFVLLIGFWIWSICTAIQAISLSEAFFIVGKTFLLISLIYITIDILNKNQDGILNLFKVFTLVVLLHALVGLLQFYGFVLIDEPGKVPYAFSTNRTLFASALALLLPFSVGLGLTANRFWKTLGWISTLIVLFAIVLSQTRSSWLAISFAFVFLHFSFLLFRKRLGSKFYKNWWKVNIGGGILFLFLIFMMYQFDRGGWLFQSLMERVQSIIGEADVKSIATVNTNERLNVWKQCFFMIQDHWFIGSGPGNWKIIAPEYLSEVPTIAEGTYPLLRAHNSWLQLTVETGLLGGLIFLSFWAFLFRTIYSLLKETSEAKQLIFYLLLTAVLIIYIIDACFSFPDERIEHGVFLSITIGMLMACALKAKKTEPPKRIIPKWSIVSTCILIIMHLAQTISHFKYQYHMQYTHQYVKHKQYSMAIEVASKTKTSWVTLGPNGDPIEVLTAQAFSEMGLYNKAIEEGLLAKQYHPNNYKVEYLLGQAYFKIGDFKNAEKVFSSGLRLVPLHAPSHYYIARILFEQQKYTECLQYIERLPISLDKNLQSLRASCQKKKSE